jgi:SAM-dependent methyltransferase
MSHEVTMSVLMFGDKVARRLEAIYRTPDIAAQREATLKYLAPKPGEHVIDVGCGPGFLTRSLAEAVGPTGRVLGADLSEPLLAMAAARCAGLSWVRLQQGDARELDLPNDLFEAATCVQVLEYVRAVDGAIAELFRLLRPGGRAVIIDADWRALVWHSTDEARMRRVVAAWEGHCSHPSLPRTLGMRLRRVGFVVEAVEVLTILNSRLHADTYSHGLIDLVRDFVVDRGALESAEAEAWAAELRDLGTRDEYFLSLGRFLFLARRPSGSRQYASRDNPKWTPHAGRDRTQVPGGQRREAQRSPRSRVLPRLPCRGR